MGMGVWVIWVYGCVVDGHLVIEGTGEAGNVQHGPGDPDLRAMAAKVGTPNESASCLWCVSVNVCMCGCACTCVCVCVCVYVCV